MRKTFLVAIAVVIGLGAWASPARADAIRADGNHDRWSWSDGAGRGSFAWAGAAHDPLDWRGPASQGILVRWDDGWWRSPPRDSRQLSNLIHSALDFLGHHDNARFSDWREGGIWSGGTGSVVDPTPSDPPAATPEPASLLLIGTGLVGLIRRRRVSRAQ